LGQEIAALRQEVSSIRKELESIRSELKSIQSIRATQKAAPAPTSAPAKAAPAPTRWAQRKEFVVLTVDVPEVKGEHIDLTENALIDRQKQRLRVLFKPSISWTRHKRGNEVGRQRKIRRVQDHEERSGLVA